MKKTWLIIALMCSTVCLYAQSEEEILNKWINTYNDLSTQKNYDGMISNFDACHAELPSWDFAYYYKGVAEYNKKDYSAAVKDLSVFTSKVDSLNVAYLMLAQCFNALSQPQDALNTLSIYVQKEPKDKTAYWEMANAHKSLNQYDAYIEDLNKVISLDNQDERAYKNLASAYAMQKNYQGAVEILDKLIEQNPQNQDYYFDRGSYKYSLKTQEGVKAAIEDFNKANELGKNDSKLFNYLYSCNSMLKNYQGVIDACNKLLELTPNDLKITFNRGNAYYRNKKYKEAISDMTSVISNENTDDKTKLTAYKTRYMCYKALNDAKNANSDLEIINKLEGK